MMPSPDPAAPVEIEIALGREIYQKNLDTYRKCVRTGTWPGYGEEIKRLSLPAWAMKREEEGLL